MILQIFNCLPRISIKIEFGSPLTLCHIIGTFFFGCSAFAIAAFNQHLQNRLSESEESIVCLSKLNITPIPIAFYCHPLYNECLCSVLSNISNISENSTPNVQLVSSQILPLVSFCSQIFLLWELFSWNTVHRHVITHALWLASIFTFIFITISIYWSSCYHAYITLILSWTGGLFCILTTHNLLRNMDHFDSLPYNNQLVVVHRSNRNRGATKARQELP